MCDRPGAEDTDRIRDGSVGLYVPRHVDIQPERSSESFGFETTIYTDKDDQDWNIKWAISSSAQSPSEGAKKLRK